MQELADGLKKLNVEPTITLIKRLIKGEDLRALIASKNVSDNFGDMPKVMQKTFQEMFDKENEADYKELIEEKAARIGNVLGKGEYPINLSFFDLKDGELYFPRIISRKRNPAVVSLLTLRVKKPFIRSGFNW